MKLPDRPVQIAFCALLALLSGMFALMTGRSWAEDLASYFREERLPVVIERIHVDKRLGSLEVTTETFVDVELQVRHRGIQRQLNATYVGLTGEHADEIRFLAANKDRQIELWIDPRWNGRFAVEQEFPMYRLTPTLIALVICLFGVWGLWKGIRNDKS